MKDQRVTMREVNTGKRIALGVIDLLRLFI